MKLTFSLKLQLLQLHIFGLYRRRRRHRLGLLVGAFLNWIAGVIIRLAIVGAVGVTLFLLDLRFVGLKWWYVVRGGGAAV